MVWTIVLVLQVASWDVTPDVVTVGDSVTIERTFTVTERVESVVSEPIANEDAIPLLDPEFILGGGQVVVTHTVAIFSSDSLLLTMPDVELRYLDGRVETRPGGEVMVRVRSVLPDVDSVLEPQASKAPLATRLTTWQPFALLVSVATIGLLSWAGLRRRVRGERPEWPTGNRASGWELESLMSVGEWQAALLLTRQRLQGSVQEDRVAALRELDNAAFSGKLPVDIREKLRHAWLLADKSEVDE